MQKRQNSAWPILLACLLVVTATALGQYSREEYNEYQAAISEPVDKRPDAIIAFINEWPESMLVDYSTQEYIKALDELNNAGKAADVVTAGEKLLALYPDHERALIYTTFAAFQSNQYEKSAQHGQKLYQSKPELDRLAFILAMSNQQTGDQEKYLEYGRIAVEKESPQLTLQIVGDLTVNYHKNKDWGNAAKYAQLLQSALDQSEKPANTSDAEWSKYMKAQRTVAAGVIARASFESGQYTKARNQYTALLNASPESASEALYFIGMCYWKENQIDPAMSSFAKGSVMSEGSAHVKVCRQYLETLYMSTHNGSLAGLDEFVERVTSSP